MCEEAGCPNIYECWADGTATFMINGDRCTRACGFCQVDTRHPLPLSPDEPERVAQAVERMRLGHAVVTCVARDDLPDGGAGAMAETISAIRSRTPGTTVEVLISDCQGDAASLDTIFEARPDVLNHNIETVARLQRAVRPSAGYARSLAVLARAGQAGLVTKSGLMVGLGEREDEVVATMADLRGVGVSIVTDRAVPAAEPGPPPGVPLLDARGVRPPPRGRRRRSASPTWRRRRSPGRATTPARRRRRRRPGRSPTTIRGSENSACNHDFVVAGRRARRFALAAPLIVAAPPVTARQPDQVLKRVIVDLYLAAETALVGQRPLDQRPDVIVIEWLQRQQQRTGEQWRDRRRTTDSLSSPR